MKSLTTTTVKLPRTTANRVASLAKRQGRTQSDVLRDAIEKGLEVQSDGPSVLDLMGDLVGCIEGGPSDLSTNPKYMKGFGLDRKARG